MDNEQRLRIQDAQAKCKADGGAVNKAIAETKACTRKRCDRQHDCQCSRVSSRMLNDPVVFKELWGKI